MNNVATFALAFLWALVQKLLTKVAQGLWNTLWQHIIVAVAEAEQKWIESGRGAEKKQWAVDTIMKAIEDRVKKLGWIQRMIVKLFIEQVIDALVAVINEEFDKGWVERIKEVERELAKKLPVIETMTEEE